VHNACSFGFGTLPITFKNKVLRKYNHRFDAEGAGEMFKVTALPFDNQEKEKRRN
jgi:hypothetical protein